MIVTALLLVTNFLSMKLQIIHNMYLFHKLLRSIITTWLKSVDFGIVNFGELIDLLNFWHILQSFTTLVIMFSTPRLISPELLKAWIICSFLVWLLTLGAYLISLYETISSSCLSSSIHNTLSTSSLLVS